MIAMRILTFANKTAIQLRPTSNHILNIYIQIFKIYVDIKFTKKNIL